MTVWLLASRLTGQPVPVEDDYPHVCGEQVGIERDRVTPILMNVAGCAACATSWRPPATRRRRR